MKLQRSEGLQEDEEVNLIFIEEIKFTRPFLKSQQNVTFIS